MQFSCCNGPAVDPLSEPEADELAAVLKVLADPVRLRLLSLIARAPGGEVCACDLVDVLDRSQPTISHPFSETFCRDPSGQKCLKPTRFRGVNHQKCLKP